ncbi:hypothetical protein BGZ83_011564 [Gryganskiella cystojenkinii]|nr:hypothetical protein BGZ83_011564 [Gryganskiella cystojenkinii]
MHVQLIPAFKLVSLTVASILCVTTTITAAPIIDNARTLDCVKVETPSMKWSGDERVVTSGDDLVVKVDMTGCDSSLVSKASPWRVSIVDNHHGNVIALYDISQPSNYNWQVLQDNSCPSAAEYFLKVESETKGGQEIVGRSDTFLVGCPKLYPLHTRTDDLPTDPLLPPVKKDTSVPNIAPVGLETPFPIPAFRPTSPVLVETSPPSLAVAPETVITAPVAPAAPVLAQILEDGSFPAPSKALPESVATKLSITAPPEYPASSSPVVDDLTTPLTVPPSLVDIAVPVKQQDQNSDASSDVPPLDMTDPGKDAEKKESERKKSAGETFFKYAGLGMAALSLVGTGLGGVVGGLVGSSLGLVIGLILAAANSAVYD